VSAPAQEEFEHSVWHMVLPLIAIVSSVFLAAALLTVAGQGPIEPEPMVEPEPHLITLPDLRRRQAGHSSITTEEDL